jgi:hypothetical protein
VLTGAKSRTEIKPTGCKTEEKPMRKFKKLLRLTFLSPLLPVIGLPDNGGGKPKGSDPHAAINNLIRGKR